MRKIFLVSLFSFLVTFAFSQKSFTQDSSYKKMDYFHFETSWLTWMNKPDSIKLKPLSHTFSFYFTYPMRIGNSKFNFIPGLGITVDNAYTNVYVKEDSAKTSISLRPITTTYKLSKETFTYLTIPIVLNYNSKGNSKSWKASVGMKFNYMLQPHTKFKGTDPINGEVSEKIKNLSVLKKYANRYRIDATASVGYDWIYLFATYSFSTYFASGKGPQMTPFNIGVGAVGF